MTLEWTEEMQTAVVDLRIAGKGLEEVARKVGVSPESLTLWCRRNGVCTARVGTADWKAWLNRPEGPVVKVPYQRAPRPSPREPRSVRPAS